MIKKERLTLAHLSDPHIFSLKGVRVRELLNKRIFGLLSWRLNPSKRHRSEILAALLQDLDAGKPDHIVITGDLTHLGLPVDFEKAQHFLRSLGPPERVTVIPGNHDAYVATAWQRTFSLWKDYMASDAEWLDANGQTNPPMGFPILRIRGRAALIGVSTARPSSPVLAVGTVGNLQLQKLEMILQETGQQGLCRVVLIHHPPVSGLVRWRKRLTDAPAFRAVLNRAGAELVLHGHLHRSSFEELNTARGRIPAIGVPSASTLGRRPGRRARYHVYHLNQSDQGWEILLSVRAFSVKEEIFIAESERRLTLSPTVTPPGQSSTP